MKLKKHIVFIIIGLTTIALVGFISLQAYLLKNVIQQEKQAFRQNVNAALSAVVRNLETREAASAMFKISLDTEEEIGGKMTIMKVTGSRDIVLSDSLFDRKRHAVRWNPGINSDSSKVVFFLPTAQHVRLKLLDASGQIVEELVDGELPAGKNEIDLEGTVVKTGSFGISLVADSLSYVANFVQGQSHQSFNFPSSTEEKRTMVSHVLAELSSRGDLAIEDRIDPNTLDSLLTSTLEEKDIQTPFAYGIVDATKADLVVLSNQPQLSGEIAASEFRAGLFPNDIFDAQKYLAIHFPEQEKYLFRQVGLLAFVSVIFILILIFSFIYIIRTLFKQKEFSGRLTNFINNMTHEFKTPISTIRLASESILNPRNFKNKARVLKYGRIIQDENIRMQGQVEKILQMAALEEGDFDLNLSRVDVHDLLEDAINKVGLQIEKRKGQIETNLRAVSHIIKADALHLANIISNMLDNALKYTRKPPSIKISTENINGSLRVKFEDNGIGLRPEDQSRVFDKYYRVPTGNVHDVKGFGLGLSYVKLMVEAHGGTIDLNSEIDKGTVFNLNFPLEDGV